MRVMQRPSSLRAHTYNVGRYIKAKRVGTWPSLPVRYEVSPKSGV